jgi:uncharacterized protein (TIGR00369 family)
MPNDTESIPYGLGQLRTWIADGWRPPMAETLDIRLVEADNGRAVFAGTPGERVYNPLGMVHGGYATTMLDSACGCAVHSSLAEHQTYTTLELKVAFHRALRWNTGPVRAEAKVVSIGRRVAFAEARLTDASGALYATATSTLLVMDLEAPHGAAAR